MIKKHKKKNNKNKSKIGLFHCFNETYNEMFYICVIIIMLKLLNYYSLNFGDQKF